MRARPRVGASCLSLLLGVGTMACGSTPAPAELHGTWVSRAAGYEGRTMRIVADSVWFGNGDQSRGYPVRSARREGGETVVGYGAGRTVYRLRLIEHPDGRLSLRNQPHVTWELEPPPR